MLTHTEISKKSVKPYQEYELDFHNAIDIRHNINRICEIIKDDLYIIEDRIDMHHNQVPNALKLSILTKHYNIKKISKIRDKMLGLIYNSQLQESDDFSKHIMAIIDYYKHLLSCEKENKNLNIEKINDKITGLVILIG